MSKDKDINNGFMVNDIVKNKLGNVQGQIQDFEWSGGRRAVIRQNKNNYFNVISVLELVLVSRPEATEEPTIALVEVKPEIEAPKTITKKE